jgi:hypothetical protein
LHNGKHAKPPVRRSLFVIAASVSFVVSGASFANAARIELQSKPVAHRGHVASPAPGHLVGTRPSPTVRPTATHRPKPKPTPKPAHRKASSAAHTPPPPPLPPVSTDSPDGLPANYQRIYSFLRANGATAMAASGILGNIGQESKGNPESTDGAGNGGLIGWTPEPASYQTGDPAADFQAQLQGLLTYIATYGSLSAINANSDSPTDAADYFMNNYERPDPAAANAPNREQVAEDVYQAEGGA